MEFEHPRFVSVRWSAFGACFFSGFFALLKKSRFLNILNAIPVFLVLVCVKIISTKFQMSDDSRETQLFELEALESVLRENKLTRISDWADKNAEIRGIIEVEY